MIVSYIDIQTYIYIYIYIYRYIYSFQTVGSIVFIVKDLCMEGKVAETRLWCTEDTGDVSVSRWPCLVL